MSDMPPEISHEHSPKVVDRLHILDFDRLLARSDELATIIYEVVGQVTNITRSRLLEIQNEQERLSDELGEAVDMWRVIESAAGGGYDLEELKQVIVKNVAQQRDELWHDGAVSLLELLRRNQQLYCIVTSGAEDWQRLKLACMGLDEVPTRVITGHDKGSIVKDWQDVSGDFVVPDDLSGSDNMVIARKLVRYDDRAKAFANDPGGVDGFWIQTGRDTSGEVSSQVATYLSIRSALPEIRERYGLTAA